MADGRVVVVTGGSRGIGRAICEAFAGPGATVVVNYRSGEDHAKETAARIEARGAKAVLSRCDIADPEAVKGAFKEILATHGQVDVLVNNAGITRDNIVAFMKLEEWDAVIQTNLRGAFLCTQAVLRGMMKRRCGSIVNISSVVAAIGGPGLGNYAAAKAGLLGFTRALALEVVTRNITVNAVAPGFIETDMTAALPEKMRDALLAEVPCGRAGKVEEVAAVVRFLASPEASYITGQCIHVNGGMFMG